MALGYIPVDLTYLILHLAFILSFGYGLFHFSKNRAEHNEVDQNLNKTSELKQPSAPQDAWSFCGNLCSPLCQIKHWVSRHQYESVEKDITADQVIRPAHGTCKFKLLNNHKMGEITPEQTRERVRYLEEELVKFKNETALLQSERDNWAMRTEFVSKRLQSFMRKCDQDQIAEEARIEERIRQEEYIKMLESEYAKAKRELQTEREHVQRLTLEREENTHIIMIKVEEARVAEMRKREKYIQLLKNELAKMKRDLREQRKHDETKQIAMRKVEEIGQHLANARNDLASAISRAEVAEAKLSDLEKKMKLTNKKICPICLNSEKDMAFGCGHMICRDCGLKMSTCPICRERITSRVRLFAG